jgi:hypothetical protein
MTIQTVTRKKDGKFHLYGQTMIGRTSPQQGKFNKRPNSRKRGKQKNAIAEATKRHKDKERRNPRVDRNRLRTQQRSSYRPDGMVRMKRTNNKRNPQGKGTPNNPRRLSRMEQAEKRRRRAPFILWLHRKERQPLPGWRRQSMKSAREKPGMLWLRKQTG